jgi:hypothetical protein
MCTNVIPMDQYIWEMARVVCAMPYDDVCSTSVFKEVTQLYWLKDEGPVRYSLRTATLAGSEEALRRMLEHVVDCAGVRYYRNSSIFVFESFEDLLYETQSLLRAAAGSGAAGSVNHDDDDDSVAKLAVFEAFMRCASNVVDVMELVDMMDSML